MGRSTAPEIEVVLEGLSPDIVDKQSILHKAISKEAL